MEELFYKIYDALPRGGPGNIESTRKAFDLLADLPEKPDILDIGCGKGIQTIELMNISDGRIVAVDNHRPFLDALKQSAVLTGLSDRLLCLQGDMFSLGFRPNAFDLIWSEGAIYILGFENGLKSCKQLVRANGYVAVTEISWLKENPPIEVAEFFGQEYPDMKDIQGNFEIIEAAGYDLIDYFILPEDAWWDDYYLPLDQQIGDLQSEYKDNAQAQELFEILRLEIDMYRKFSDYYGYVFYIISPNSPVPY